MGAIFQSLGRTVTAGVVLLILLILAVSTAKYDHAWGAFVMREPQRNRANIARLFQLWEQGKIQPRVTGTYALADGGQAIAKLGDRSAVGKLVVTI